MKPKETTTLLLDSDIIAYKFAFSNQSDFDWNGDGNKVSILERPIEEVMDDCFDYVEDLRDKLKAQEAIVCLSCPTPENFRVKLLPTYKANRDPNAKPLQLSLVKEKLAAKYPNYARPTLEADDIMGILSTHPNIVKGRKIIVSEDKDMQTIPGLLFNPRKDTKPRLITTEAADRYHLYQTLIGDATDNYSGCPGMGPEKAVEFLNEPYTLVPFPHVFTRGPRKGQEETRYSKVLLGSWGPSFKKTLWEAIVSLFHRQGLTEEDALVQARVARILRCTDYNFDKKEPILWQPN